MLHPVEPREVIPAEHATPALDVVTLPPVVEPAPTVGFVVHDDEVHSVM